METVADEQFAGSERRHRILLATIGSLGDLHPCLALGLELQRRGHSVAIASTPYYQEKVVNLGIDFHPMRPDWRPDDSELIRQCEDLRTGPEVLFRRLILPHLRDTYDDLARAAKDADLLIAGELVFAAPLVAEKCRLPWISAILSPCSFLSAHDPSVLVNLPDLIRLRRAGWAVNRAVLNLGRMATRRWWTPVRDLRHELGLRRECDPLRDKFSPYLTLALFSRFLAQPQPDWPAKTVQPGFVFFNRRSANDASWLETLANFLQAGEAPLVFTLGSTAVHNAGNFYEVSVEAAKQLGRRAILIGVPGVHSADMLALPYASFAEVFPHAAAIVHQGGSGTTGQALRAGRPMLVIPYGWDQPDNGARVERAGAGLCIARKAYTPETATIALKRLIDVPSFADNALRIGKRLSEENGLTAACDAIELLLASVRSL